MSNQVNWTASKLKMVKNEVKKSPENLTQAFKRVAEKFGCAHTVISAKWYNDLRKGEKVFETSSSKGKKINLKNKRTNNSTFLYEKIVNTKMYDGVKVVMVKKYYTV